MSQHIIIKGARVHNLKNINLKIPRNKLIVITGVSGSGKSSLAFDTLYAEGQRRYVESLSSYARQFLGLAEKPEVDSITGLSPAIAIDQKTRSRNPRSTVGTVTEIYDYLRLLFARIGRPHCPQCGQPVSKQTADQIVKQTIALIKNKTAKGIKQNKTATSQKGVLANTLFILAPVIQNKKGEHRQVLAEIRKAGFVRVRLDGYIMNIAEAEEKKITPTKHHNIDIVVDRIIIGDHISRSRLTDSLEKALEFGNGVVILHKGDNRLVAGVISSRTADIIFSQNFACPYCQISLPSVEPHNFSFNSPYGACPACAGLGYRQEISPALILNPEISLAEGAVRPWFSTASAQGWYVNILKELSKVYHISLNLPVKKLPAKQINLILYGPDKSALKPSSLANDFNPSGSHKNFNQQLIKFEGVIPNLENRYRETQSDYVRYEIEKYMITRDCQSCLGQRLKKESLAVKIAGVSIAQAAELKIKDAVEFFNLLEQNRLTYCSASRDRQPCLPNKTKIDPEPKENFILSLAQQKIALPILKEIKERLNFLINVGLAYLSLSRNANSLSGGESQRIRLATQIGSGLSGVLYILDEPTIGLHPYDNARLIRTLIGLKNLGNTVIVVEHDRETIEHADWLIDIGPGAGELGGEVVFAGERQQLPKALKKSLTAQYLLGQKSLAAPEKYRTGNGKFLEIKGASEHNLKNIDIKIPLGKFVCVTGVSGSGKSTVVSDILARALKQKFYQAKEPPGKHQEILGLANIDKVIEIDQSPIGRTPRSNPATYTGLFTPIRDLFSCLPEAKIRGYQSGRFSFNVKAGRCDACRGDGLIRIEMHFLPEVYVECEECRGRRYNKETLEVHYKGKSIADILAFTVGHAQKFFSAVPPVKAKLKLLAEVGLDYIKLGQAATTLSGGEAQRIKLATELARRSTGKTLYILDEPTTGLHFADIKKLLLVLNKLADLGNTILLIEHNLDVIKAVDWIIDLGPGAGEEGGQIVAEGAPPDIINCQQSHTGQALKKILG